jgi:hypothetical protein
MTSKRIQKWHTILLISLCGLIINCSNETEDCTASVGPISCGEFQKQAIPTYKQFLNSYEEAITAEPDLLNDENGLALEIFNDIKAQPTPNISTNPMFTLDNRMCEEEWKLVLTKPIKSYTAMKASIQQSLTAAMEKFPQDAGKANSKADGFRRAYWVLLMIDATDTNFAKEMAEAHQTCDPGSITLSGHNLAVGIDLIADFPTATPIQLFDLLLERRYQFIDGQIPSDIGDAIVFNIGRQKYDAAYEGIMTNPDIGRIWECSFYLHQDNNIIRGEYIVTYNNDFLSRRFSGLVNNDGTLSIDISYPYAFELPSNIVPCENAKAVLTENGDNLLGPWTSTNCRQGGTIDVDKID